MAQSNDPKNIKRQVRSCSTCGAIYDQTIAFCPADGNKLTEYTIGAESISAHDSGPVPVKQPSEEDTILIGQDITHPFSTASSEYAEDWVGKVIDGRFRIESIIGSGGMSVVYRAKEFTLGRDVALKMLLPHTLAQPQSLQRFQQEARAASNLSHPNVINVYGFGVPDGQPYLAMDYLDGVALSDLIGHGKRMPVDRAVHIFIQIAGALDHAHSKSVIHRDLKPSNVILVTSGDDHDHVKILDFGIAKMMNEEGTEGGRLTRTGEVFGSPLYMSPEQTRGEQLDARSDIYSLGCLMYETLTGETPHQGGSSMEIMYRHVHAVPDQMSGPRNKVPQRMEKIVFKALAKDPRERYQTMAALCGDLNEFANEQKFGILAKVKDRLELLWLKRRPKSAHEKAIAGVCAVLALVTICLGVWLANLYTSAANSRASKQQLAWQEPRVVIEQDSSRAKHSLTVKRASKRKRSQIGLQVATLSWGFDSDPNIAIRSWTRCAEECMETGQYQEALEFANKACRKSIEVNGDTSVLTVWTMVQLAECTFHLGDYKSAETFIQRVIHISRTNIPMVTSVIAHEYYLLGMIKAQQDKWIEAERYYKKALSAWGEMFEHETLSPTESKHVEYGSNLPSLAPSEEFTMCLARLADVELRLHDYDDARQYYTSVAQYCSAANSNTGQGDEIIENEDRTRAVINQSIAYDRIGQVDLITNQNTDSLESYRKALKLMQDAVGNGHVYVAVVTNEYANALWQTGNYLESLRQKYKALELFAKLT